jgi:putative transcriptional regulator
MAHMSIQNALKNLRIELGLSQEDLAKQLNKGFVTINRWENGKSFPSRANSLQIIELAKKNHISPDSIQYLEDTLLPDCKRGCPADSFGFPNIDKNFLFQLADNSTNAVYIIDELSFELLYVNRVAEKMASRDLADSGIEDSERKFATVKDKRCFHFFTNHTSPCSFCPITNPKMNDGHDHYVTVEASHHQYKVHTKEVTVNGRLLRVVYLTDVTDLAKERLALYEMANDIPNGVAIYNVYRDWHLELLFMNLNFAKMFSNNLLNFPDRRVIIQNNIHPEDKEKLFTEVKESLQEERNVEISLRIKNYQNVYQTKRLTARLIQKDDEKYTYYCIFE